MDTQLLIICILTFVIHLIGTLAYAVRISGVHTRRIAVCFSLFNILILVSRISNSLDVTRKRSGFTSKPDRCNSR